MRRALKPFMLALCGGLWLSGCGSDDSAGDNVKLQPQTAAKQALAGVAIDGTVTKGPVHRAVVNIYKMQPDGSPGEFVAGPFITDAAGRWQGQLPAGITTPLVLVASGGRYQDEASGEPVELAPGDELHGVIADVNTSQVAAPITPYTHALLAATRQQIGNGDNAATILRQVRRNVTLQLGFDPMTVLPPNPMRPPRHATLAQKQYAAMLGGFAQLAQEPPLRAQLTMPRFKVMQALAEDMADGRLDGRNLAGFPVIMRHNRQQVMLPPLGNNLRPLFANVERFIGNHGAAYPGVRPPHGLPEAYRPIRTAREDTVNRALLCEQDVACQQQANQQIPYYFMAIHNEPSHYGPQSIDKIARDYATLQKMVAKADSYRIKLTIMFAASWADYIAKDSQRLAEVQRWKANGHELATHHHDFYHPNWDGYSALPVEDVVAYRQQSGRSRHIPLGDLDDFMQQIWRIDPDIRSGCLNDAATRATLPDAIVYDTCSGYNNYGLQAGVPGQDVNPKKGINQFVSVGRVNGIERRWLAHHFMGKSSLQAREVFNQLDNGVYGGVVHSFEEEYQAFEQYLDFLHQADPDGEHSLTVSAIIEQRLLPEKMLTQPQVDAVDQRVIE